LAPTSRRAGIELLRLLQKRRRLGSTLAEENVSLDGVGQPDFGLVGDEVLGRDGEDFCGNGR